MNEKSLKNNKTDIKEKVEVHREECFNFVSTNVDPKEYYLKDAETNIRDHGNFEEDVIEYLKNNYITFNGEIRNEIDLLGNTGLIFIINDPIAMDPSVTINSWRYAEDKDGNLDLDYRNEGNRRLDRIIMRLGEKEKRGSQEEKVIIEEKYINIKPTQISPTTTFEGQIIDHEKKAEGSFFENYFDLINKNYSKDKAFNLAYGYKNNGYGGWINDNYTGLYRDNKIDNRRDCKIPLDLRVK